MEEPFTSGIYPLICFLTLLTISVQAFKVKGRRLAYKYLLILNCSYKFLGMINIPTPEYAVPIRITRSTYQFSDLNSSQQMF